MMQCSRESEANRPAARSAQTLPPQAEKHHPQFEFHCRHPGLRRDDGSNGDFGESRESRTIPANGRGANHFPSRNGGESRMISNAQNPAQERAIETSYAWALVLAWSHP